MEISADDIKWLFHVAKLLVACRSNETDWLCLHDKFKDEIAKRKTLFVSDVGQAIVNRARNLFDICKKLEAKVTEKENDRQALEAQRTALQEELGKLIKEINTTGKPPLPPPEPNGSSFSGIGKTFPEWEREWRQVAGNGGNGFFGPNRRYEMGESGRLYAAYEIPQLGNDDARRSRFGPTGPETDQIDEPILLECVDAEWVDRNRDSSRSWMEIQDEVPLAAIELDNLALPPIAGDITPGRIVWFELQYAFAHPAEGDGNIYFSLFGPGSRVAIRSMEQRDAGHRPRGLLGKLEWLDDSQLPPPNEVTRVLRAMPRPSMGVAIYDVGQGAMQAHLVNLEGHIFPVLYVDFGGGVMQNLKTFPEEFNNVCFGAEPPIVLSHWDWDHWSSACRFPQALTQRWLAPPIPEKPIQQTFASMLNRLGKLHIWTNTMARTIKIPNALFERCNGKTSNDSGIAVTLLGGMRASKKCLLPGDADYRFIPSVIPEERFNSISITHHGGRLHSDEVPTAKRGGRLACSAGTGNSYKHPFWETIEAHLKHGWSLPLNTGHFGQRPSHILLPWEGAPYAFSGKCSTDNGCNVSMLPSAATTGAASVT